MVKKIKWDVRVTYNSLMVALVSLPLIFAFMLLSYELITTAFINEDVRDNIESYIAVLGILSGPAYMSISRFFDRWNAEEEEYIEAVRRKHKTENDITRASGKLKEDEGSIEIRNYPVLKPQIESEEKDV